MKILKFIDVIWNRIHNILSKDEVVVKVPASTTDKDINVSIDISSRSK